MEHMKMSDEYSGMSLRERLKYANLLGYYETALGAQDKDWLKQILRLVSIDEGSIELLLCKEGVY